MKRWRSTHKNEQSLSSPGDSSLEGVSSETAIGSADGKFNIRITEYFKPKQSIGFVEKNSSVSVFRAIAGQSRAAGSLCVEKPLAGNEELLKRVVENPGADYVYHTPSSSNSRSESLDIKSLAIREKQREDVSSSNHKDKQIPGNRFHENQPVIQAEVSTSEPNPRVGPQNDRWLELSSPVKREDRDHTFSHVDSGTRSTSSADDGDIKKMASLQASALLEAALDAADEEAAAVKKEHQLSLRVAVVGAPNAGKSLLTNKLVGSRVSAVSRKTNTTHREHLGVYTKGDTQLCFYDTPGLHLDIEGSPLRVDARSRVQSAWQILDACEAVVVLVDAERQIRRPDRRVKRLVEKIGMEQVVDQKKILCLNKVDLIEQKRLLLPLAKEFENLPAYDRIFMISGLTGSGVNDVKEYLLHQAIASPWEEDPDYSNHRDIALEIVREQIFEHLHEELPHTTNQKLVSWKVLKDGSIRIQQLLTVPKKEHQKILVGKNGAVIGEIGVKARKELSTILGVNVHLVLDVKHDDGE
ncbi:hypothetical protein R1flu_020201 [Riccia fluitans]|uniref:GTP-binding protein Era n=1 Tax=Riccia fluitans TaxID=41844 RepID=A0ABD1ZKV8_9MARC